MMQVVGIFVDLMSFGVDESDDNNATGVSISRAHIVSAVVEVDTRVNDTLCTGRMTLRHQTL